MKRFCMMAVVVAVAALASGQDSFGKGPKSGGGSKDAKADRVKTVTKIDLVKTDAVKFDIVKTDIVKKEVVKKEIVKKDIVKIDVTTKDIHKVKISPKILKLEPAKTTLNIGKINTIKPIILPTKVVKHWPKHHHHHYHTGCWWPVWYPACFPPIYLGGDPVVIENETVVVVAETTEAEEANYQDERMLKVVNDTKEQVEFFILMHTEDESGKWDWMPDRPGQPKNVINFTLKPGEELLVADGDETFAANKIRIWAKSKTRQWNDYRDADLWIVELDAAGERRYEAAELETFTFRLPQ